MLYDFAAALVVIGLGFLVVPLTLGLGAVLRPSRPYPNKISTYECGEIPVGSSWVRFNVRFYMVAISFLIFDVEVMFMFPIAAVFREWVKQGHGLHGVVAITIFAVVLLVGLAYTWRKGDLEWIRTYRKLATSKPRSAEAKGLAEAV